MGFDVIDYSSFVSKRHIPQLVDAAEVLDGLGVSESKTKLLALVGSKNGGEIASQFEKIDYIAYPFSVSETFLKYNLNSDFIKSIETIEYIQNLCEKTGKELILYFAMAFGNPYGDKWNADLVFEWIEKFRKLDLTKNRDNARFSKMYYDLVMKAPKELAKYMSDTLELYQNNPLISQQGLNQMLDTLAVNLGYNHSNEMFATIRSEESLPRQSVEERIKTKRKEDIDLSIPVTKVYFVKEMPTENCMIKGLPIDFKNDVVAVCPHCGNTTTR